MNDGVWWSGIPGSLVVTEAVVTRQGVKDLAAVYKVRLE
jgi:hypothetical protein